MILRAMAIVAGLLLLAASAHAVIDHAGGYGTPHAYITMALAGGIGVGALTIGAAMAQRRYTLAGAICIALLAGEAFALLSTAERLVAQREAAQAPIREALAARSAAERRVAEAQSALATLTSARLQAAEAAKRIADQAAIEKAAERGCAANCRLLLEQQTAAADREVQSARVELAASRSAREAELSSARAALAKTAVPPSATPLADRLGLPAWALDLLAAALGSIAANGLAGCLLAFGGHGGAHRDEAKSETKAKAPAVEAPPAEPERKVEQPPPSAREQAARFGVERLRPAADTYVPLQDLRSAYRDWCRGAGFEPLDDQTIGAELAALFSRAGLQGDVVNGKPVVRGVRLDATPMLSARM